MLALRSGLLRAACASTLEMAASFSSRAVKSAGLAPITPAAPRASGASALKSAHLECRPFHRPSAAAPAAALRYEQRVHHVQCRSFAADAGGGGDAAPLQTWQNDLGQALQLIATGSPDAAREMLQKGGLRSTQCAAAVPVPITRHTLARPELFP